MQPSLALQAGTKRFPFPRRVYHPTGKYWIGNRNGTRNAIIVNGLLLAVMGFVVWPWAMKHEIRAVPPNKPTFSMRHLEQYKDDPYGEKMFAGQVPYVPLKHEH